jgi:two-component system cell cycle response regulator
MGDKENVMEAMQILLVDDNTNNLNVLRETLELRDYEVMIAKNGETALKIATRMEPDLILLDVMMPGISGFETCRRLKEDDVTQKIPVIFLTAKAGPEDIVEGFKSGGVDYISKPFQIDEVLAKSETHIQFKKTLEEKIRLFDESRVMKEKLIKSEAQYRTIVETASDLIFKLDPNQNITFINSAFKYLGYDSSEVMGEPIKNFIDVTEENEEEILSLIGTDGVGPLATTSLEVKFRTNMGAVTEEKDISTTFLLDAFGIWNVSDERVFQNDPERKFLGTLCIAREITELKYVEDELRKNKAQLVTVNEELRKIARLDELTKMFNRRWFDETIEQEWRRAFREKSHLGLIMFDIDFFQKLNDIYGHQAGDECLRKIGITAFEIFKRPGDLLARYGGEEFAVILPNTDEDGAFIIGERLREKIESLEVEFDESKEDIDLTISLGVASMVPQSIDGYSELISKAENALHQAKEKGRNQVVKSTSL